MSGGVNWGVFDDEDEFAVAEPDMDDHHIAVIGPELDTPAGES